MSELDVTSPVVAALCGLVEAGPWEGTAGQLLDEVRSRVDSWAVRLPKDATRLAGQLRRSRVALADVGLVVSRRRSAGLKLIRLGRVDRYVLEEAPAGAAAVEVVPVIGAGRAAAPMTAAPAAARANDWPGGIAPWDEPPPWVDEPCLCAGRCVCGRRGVQQQLQDAGDWPARWHLRGRR